jgi:polysaccharide pyruvyl transferase WcaK-like protein
MLTKENLPKCILWGGYGSGNIGDDITLAVALHDMRAKFGESIAILSTNFKSTKYIFPDVNVIPYVTSTSPFYRILKRFRQIILKLEHQSIFALQTQNIMNYFFLLLSQQFCSYSNIITQVNKSEKCDYLYMLHNCQLLYLVGGGYLTDLFILKPIIIPILAARLIRIPINTAPIGIGPFRFKRNSDLVASILKDAKVVVRDKDSLQWCYKNNIFASFRLDDGFRIIEIFPDLYKKELKSDDKLIGVCIFYQHGSNISYTKFKYWCCTLLKLLIKNGFRLEGFCFHTNPDLDFRNTQEIFSTIGLDPKLVIHPFIDFRQAIKQLNKYRFIITTRFHAAVSAGALGIPYLSIASGNYYITKMYAAMHSQTPCLLSNPLIDKPKDIFENIMSILSIIS